MNSKIIIFQNPDDNIKIDMWLDLQNFLLTQNASNRITINEIQTIILQLKFFLPSDICEIYHTSFNNIYRFVNLLEIQGTKKVFLL